MRPSDKAVHMRGHEEQGAPACRNSVIDHSTHRATALGPSYWIRMFRVRMTLPHLALLAATYVGQASGGCTLGVTASAARRSRVSGASMAAAQAAFRRAMIGCGVPAGTN